MSLNNTVPHSTKIASPENFLSMIPLIFPGDKTIVERAQLYKPNDIVVFKKSQQLIAHRVVYIPPSRQYLITKGDNNLRTDGKIRLSSILGKVEGIERDKQAVLLSHIYFSQSSAYLQELKGVHRAFSRQKIQYILLKGLPLHLHLDKTPPKRLYLDADLLIKRKDSRKVTIILNKLGFEKQRSSLFEKQIKSPSQLCFVKNTKPFLTVIDLHLEPAIGFTKVKALNQLLPSTEPYGEYLFDNIALVKINRTDFPLLNLEALTVYLLLHLFHHNFQGAHRMSFISDLIKNQKINWDKVVSAINKYKFKNFIFPAILMLRQYHQVAIPKKHLEVLTPSFGPKLVSYTIVKFFSPFDTGSRAYEGAKRFIFLLTLSPSPYSQKLRVFLNKEVRSYFLPTIKSFFFRTPMNSSKSRSA